MKFRDTVPVARDQTHTSISGGGHFLQEKRPEELARVITGFIRTTS